MPTPTPPVPNKDRPTSNTSKSIHTIKHADGRIEEFEVTLTCTPVDPEELKTGWYDGNQISEIIAEHELREAIKKTTSSTSVSDGDLIIRPASPYEDQISFLKKPTGELVDLVQGADGLKFAYLNSEGELEYQPHYTLESTTYDTIDWLLPFTVSADSKPPVVRLPRMATPFTNLDILAEEMRQFIHRYADLREDVDYVAVLYALHTWVYERWRSIPYLRFIGELSSGKTRATQTIGALCNRPISVSGSMSIPAVYRIIEQLGGTMLIDEADFQAGSDIGSDIGKILNNGYEQGTPVVKMFADPESGRMVPTKFDVFGPKIINGRRPFQDEATESRCLVYTPQPTTRPDIPLQLPPEFEAEAREIRGKALSWRFLRLNDPPWVKIPGSEARPRTQQITIPLWQVVGQMGEENRREYTKYLSQYLGTMEVRAQARGQNTPEGVLLKAYIDWKGAMAPTCGDLAERANMQDSSLKLSPAKTGGILESMGATSHRTKRGYVPSFTVEKLDELKRRYGVD